jgi:hypothetical protein
MSTGFWWLPAAVVYSKAFVRWLTERLFPGSRPDRYRWPWTTGRGSASPATVAAILAGIARLKHAVAG